MGTADHDGRSLRAGWDENAAAWLRWARSPELDHAFWHMNLPTLIELLPPPGEITLDVGCGEGRVARALKELGHVVVGVESSPALARAATEGDSAFEVHVADAAAMPLPDGLADVAVASLSLMNMDDMPGVVSEVARVLRPEGRLCFSILHPINSWGDAEAGYFETVRYHEQPGSGRRADDLARHAPSLGRLFRCARGCGLPRGAGCGAGARRRLHRGISRGGAVA
jgi:SAM-dependent methyltransferase